MVLRPSPLICGGPSAFTSAAIFEKCGVKLARRAGTLHPQDLGGSGVIMHVDFIPATNVDICGRWLYLMVISA